MSSPPTDPILQELVRERDAFATYSRDKLAQMDEAIRARKKTLEGFHFPTPSNAVTEDGLATGTPFSKSNELAGLAYPALVHRILSLQPARQPLTVNGILEVMELHGIVPNAQDPRNTVKTALNRRKAKVGDVVHTGLGEWGLVEWYTPSELEKFKRAQDGANARDATLHKANMKKGIAAAQARGAYYGKPPKITEEMWNLAIKLFADEGRSTAYVHKKIMELAGDGDEPMTKASLGNRRQQFLNREPYPARWRAYFEQRKRALKMKAELENPERELRLVKK